MQMPKAKKKRTARALPPITQAELGQFKERAREGIKDPKAEYDYAVALYVKELKKEKYSERAKKGDAKHWWEGNLQDLCLWKDALRDLRILKAFPVPDPKSNFAAFGAVELDLGITYANDKGIPIPADPRLLAIDFLDDDGEPTHKMFPDCSYSELLLAVHGVERKHKHPVKLEPADKEWLDIALKTLRDCDVESPENHFIGRPEGENAFWSLLRISNGQIKAVLNGLSQAINDFYAQPVDRS
jgi:hypothetical protein